MIAVALLALATLLQGTNTARPAGVRASFTVQPETVRVGDPATLRVRIIAPEGTRIVFPGAVDSTSGVEPLDPVVIEEHTKDGVLESIASYRVLAWEVGLPTITLGAIRVDQGGATQELRLSDPRVFVVSTLPADTALRIPKPSRDIAFLSPANWPLWLLVVAGFAVAAVIGVWLQRRSRRPPAPIAPFAQAQHAFGRLRALDLIGAGEPAKHVAASADILREFLAARGAGVALGLTTTELLHAVERDESVPQRRVAELLTAADESKFAATDVDAPTAERLGAAAASIVADVYKIDVKRVRSR